VLIDKRLEDQQVLMLRIGMSAVRIKTLSGVQILAKLYEQSFQKIEMLKDGGWLEPTKLLWNSSDRFERKVPDRTDNPVLAEF
jgi:hypothetical protein